MTDRRITTDDIGDNQISLAKLRDIATARILGRSTAGTGDVEALTVAQTKTLLALAAGDVSDFTEAVQDVVGALLGADSGDLDFTYDDAGNAVSVILKTSIPTASPDLDTATHFDLFDLLHAETNNLAAQSSGQLLVHYFTAPRSFTVDAITYHTRSTAASGLTLCRFALYTAAANGDVTLVARTANDTSLLIATNTLYTKAFDTTGGYPSTYALVKGTKYAVGVLQVGTTPASFMGVTVLTTVNTGNRRRSALKGSLTDIDANIATLSDDNRVPWCSLRKV